MALNSQPECWFAQALFPTSDRRAAGRVRGVCLNVKVERGAEVGLFRARNISDAGIMLRTHVAFAPGERLIIGLSDQVTMRGSVAWCTDDHCGVRFDRRIDCAKMLSIGAELKRQDRRGGLRLAAARRATSYAENGIRAVRVADVSHLGMGLVHDGSLAPGMLLKLVVDSGIVRDAAVRWSDASRAGIRLLQPLSCEELGLLSAGPPVSSRLATLDA
jgi:hypothetical protein